MSAAWTADDLALLERAVAQGALRVEYGDKKIEYRSLDDMYRLIDTIRRDLGLVNVGNSGRKYAQFDKGLK